MIPTPKYKRFISDLIRRHMLILGPNIARDVAFNVAGLSIDSSGDVRDIAGDRLLVTKDLIRGYMALSSPVTQLVTYELLENYPDIRVEYNEPMTDINLTCSLKERQSTEGK